MVKYVIFTSVLNFCVMEWYPSNILTWMWIGQTSQQINNLQASTSLCLEAQWLHVVESNKLEYKGKEMITW